MRDRQTETDRQRQTDRQTEQRVCERERVRGRAKGTVCTFYRQH